jgi:hypothetical protein
MFAQIKRLVLYDDPKSEREKEAIERQQVASPLSLLRSLS